MHDIAMAALSAFPWEMGWSAPLPTRSQKGQDRGAVY